MKVTYSNSGRHDQTVEAVHSSAIDQAKEYKRAVIGEKKDDGSPRFNKVVAFPVTQVVNRFVVSGEVGGGGGGGGGGQKKKK